MDDGQINRWMDIKLEMDGWMDWWLVGLDDLWMCKWVDVWMG